LRGGTSNRHRAPDRTRPILVAASSARRLRDR
jgi:hypothetical protein